MSKISQMRLGEYDKMQDDAYLGAVRNFMDKDHDNPDAVTPLSGTDITAVYVQNDSGGTLAGGLGVNFKSNAIGKKIGALSGANLYCDGVVDPFLSVAVPNGSYFWLIIAGPCKVEIGAGDITAGAVVQTIASGKFAGGTRGTNPIGHCGTSTEAVASGSRARVYLNLPFSTIVHC
jgi:hypothetical protein